MSDVFEKSLVLVDEVLGKTSDSEFLKEYLEVEKNIGPLAEEFIMSMRPLDEDVGVILSENSSDMYA